MRIEHALRALVAVLHLTVLLIITSSYVSSNSSFPEHLRHSHKVEWSQHLTLREKQLFLLQQSGPRNDGIDCCPQVMEMVEPLGGRDPDGALVNLYRDDVNRQRFYEYSCLKEVLGKPCRFQDKKMYNQSRCVQEHSYTYALIQDNGTHTTHAQVSPPAMQIKGASATNTNWSLGYIRVRSGCRCKLYPKENKTKKKKKKHQYDGGV